MYLREPDRIGPDRATVTARKIYEESPSERLGRLLEFSMLIKPILEQEKKRRKHISRSL